MLPNSKDYFLQVAKPSSVLAFDLMGLKTKKFFTPFFHVLIIILKSLWWGRNVPISRFFSFWTYAAQPLKHLTTNMAPYMNIFIFNFHSLKAHCLWSKYRDKPSMNSWTIKNLLQITYFNKQPPINHTKPSLPNPFYVPFQNLRNIL